MMQGWVDYLNWLKSLEEFEANAGVPTSEHTDTLVSQDYNRRVT